MMKKGKAKTAGKRSKDSRRGEEKTKQQVEEEDETQVRIFDLV